MNTQKAAIKIWEFANKIQSKIEANEYKNYLRLYFLLSSKFIKILAGKKQNK